MQRGYLQIALIVSSLSLTPSMSPDIAVPASAESPAFTLRLDAAPAQAATSQGQPQTMKEAVAQAQPSQVFMGIGKKDGVSYQMVTDFTPAEIDAYPDYKGAFTQHAALNLGSDNPQDLEAIAHLVTKHPDMGIGLGQVAENYAGAKFNNDIRKIINRANRKPLMDCGQAAQVVKGSLTMGYVYSMMLKNLNRVNDSVADETPLNIGLGTMREDTVDYIKNLPINIPIGITTLALNNLILRGFDERVGDLWPCPPYDPKGKNEVREERMKLKKVLRDSILPAVLRNFVVAPVVNAAAKEVMSTYNTGDLLKVNWLSAEIEL